MNRHAGVASLAFVLLAPDTARHQQRAAAVESGAIRAMEIPGFYQTIAEISVAIAGFSGLIIALRKDAGPLTRVQKYRLQVLLLLSFGAMFLSLVPEFLLYWHIPDEILWRMFDVVLIVYSLAFLSWWVSDSMRIRDTDPEIFNWFAFSRMIAGHVIIVLVLLSAVLPLPGPPIVAACSLALLWYLVHAAQQFTRMLFIRPRSDVS